MSAVQQVANSFVTEFFERLAKNPTDLADLYGRHSSLTINDFELGTTEAQDSDVAMAAQQWAMIIQGSQLRVESVNAAPLYGGVNVFVTLTTTSDVQQYFQITSTLESYSSGFAVEGYYIRHQIISRIGSIPVQQPSTLGDAAAAEASVGAAPSAVPAVPESASVREEKEPVEEPVKGAQSSAAAAPETAKSAPVTKTAPDSGKPKSWASLASTAPQKAAEHKTIRVVAYNGPQKEEESVKAPLQSHAAAGAAAGAVAAGAAAGAPVLPAREQPRRERKSSEHVGDRLMFNIPHAVTDDEIREALGTVAPSLVSLRNNSAKGYVFMDFAPNIKAFEMVRTSNPVIGIRKTSIIIQRQRYRDPAGGKE